MAQLEVRFTPKGKKDEETFYLRNNDKGFYLSGSTADNRDYVVVEDDNTKVFKLKKKKAFEETPEVVEERMLGLYEEWIEAQSQGFETDKEDMPQSQKPGYGPNDIIVSTDSYSISDLMRMVDNEDIEIAPHFQRHFVWDRTRQSRLIESIFLGLPLPAIYLSEYDDGRMTIVDGLQRIRTIKAFIDNKLRLCNMEYFDFCNGKTFENIKLPELQLRRFKRTQITCFKIDYRSPSQLKYDLFRRLNTGGKALNNQEIRNCLSRKPVQDTLYDMISSEEFKSATCRSIKDTRMAAQESALRFICFYDFYTSAADLSGYDGNMSRALDSCVERLNKASKQELDNYKKLFRDSMKLAKCVFGEYAFRKVSRGYQNSKRKSSINKSLMLATTVLLAVNGDKYISDTNITDKFVDLLKKDKKLQDAISWSTSNKDNILHVFDCLKTLFDKYLTK